MGIKDKGQWRSRIGFLLASVGACAGYGIVSEFPERVVTNGGYRFILVYGVLLALAALSVLPAAMTAGRKWGCSAAAVPVKIKKAYLPAGFIFLLLALLAGAFTLMFSCYALKYFMGFVLEIGGKHGFTGITIGQIIYQEVDTQKELLIQLAAAVVAVAAILASIGVRNAVEFFARISLPVIISLFILITVYGFIVLNMVSVNDGYLSLYLAGNSSHWSFMKTLREAGAQVSEGILLGIGIIVLYAAKTSEKAKISKDVWFIPGILLILTIVAGGAMIPVTAACGSAVDFGGQFLFWDMYDAFIAMGTAGNLLGAMFYLAVILLCFLMTIACIELCASGIQEILSAKISKNMRTLWSVLSSGVMLGIAAILIRSEGSLDGNLMRAFRFIAEGILAPIGSILVCVFSAWCTESEAIKAAIETPVCKWRLRIVAVPMIKYVMPILLFLLMVSEITAFIK